MPTSMSYSDRIEQASSPREAMRIVGEGLDEVLAALASRPSVDDAGSWGSWGGDTGAVNASGAASPPQDNPYEPVRIPVDPMKVANLEALHKAANEQMEAMRHAGATAIQLREQLGVIEGLRGQIDLAKNPGSILPVSGDMVGDPEPEWLTTELSDDGETIRGVVDLPTVSDEVKAARRMLAERVDLPSMFPVVQRYTPEAEQEIIENYVKGGPLWLYYGGAEGRDIVLKLPRDVRDEMVREVYETSGENVRFAHELARDILMERSDEEVANAEFATDIAHAGMDRGGEPYRGRGEG